MAKTTADLLASISKIAAIPVAQNTFSNADILDIASDCVETEILPTLLQARQDFYVVMETVTTSTAAGEIYPSFRIPHRAVGQSIIGVYDASTDDPIDPRRYWVEGSKILFDIGSQSTYRIRYYLRPSRMVETSEAGLITSIDRVTGVIGLSAIPATFLTSVVCDFIRARAGSDTLGTDKTITAIDDVAPDYSVTFAPADIPTDLAVGDYVTLSEETPVPQVPVEWISFMSYWVANNLLEELGDTDAAKVIAVRLKRLETKALSLVQPRVEAKSKAILRPYTSRRNRYW